MRSGSITLLLILTLILLQSFNPSMWHLTSFSPWSILTAHITLTHCMQWNHSLLHFPVRIILLTSSIYGLASTPVWFAVMITTWNHAIAIQGQPSPTPCGFNEIWTLTSSKNWMTGMQRASAWKLLVIGEMLEDWGGKRVSWRYKLKCVWHTPNAWDLASQRVRVWQRLAKTWQHATGKLTNEWAWGSRRDKQED